MSVDKSKFTSRPSTLAPLLEEDESASRSPKGVHLGKIQPTPYVTQTSDAPPSPKIRHYSPEEIDFWDAKYEEARTLYDDGEYYETIAMLEDLQKDPECPRIVQIRFLVLMSECFYDYDAVESCLHSAEQLWDIARRLNPEGHSADVDKAMAIARLDLDNTRKTVSEVFAAAQIADEDDNDDNFKFNQWAGAERKEDRRQSLGIDLKRLATIAQVTYIESRQADRIKALRKVVEKTEVDRNDADQQQKELLRRVHDLEELAKNYRSDMAAATKQSSDLTVFKELLTAVKELMAAVTKERSSDMALVKELLSAMAKERSSDMAIVKELLAATTKQSGTVKQSRGNMITATRETIDPEAMQALKDEITTLKQELENLRPIKRFLDNHYAHRNTSTKDKSESGITEGSRSSRQDDQTGSSIPRHDSQSRLLDVFKPDTGASQDQLKNRHSDSTLRTARDMSHKLFRKLPGSKTSLHH